MFISSISNTSALYCILSHVFVKKPDNVILLASLIFLSAKKKIGEVVKFFQLHTYIHVEKQFGLLAFAVDSGPAKDIFITITPRNAALQ